MPTVRRFTLVTIIVLTALLVGAALFQLLVPRDVERYPGGPLRPRSTVAP